MPRRVFPDLKTFLSWKDAPTATELADELGISYAFMSNIRWGQREPGLDLAIKIADRCNIPLESLIVYPHQPKLKRAS